MEIRHTRVSTQPLAGTAPLVEAPAPQPPAPPPVHETTMRHTRDTNTLAAAGQASELMLQAQYAVLGFEGNAHYQALKAAGKLTPEVTSELARLATRPLAPGIDRAALIADVLRDLAAPASINQGSRQTCAAAVVQTTLALEDPAGYLRLVSDLASPAGGATLANGDPLTRDPGWRQNGGASLSADLLQPAFMQYATGGTYDSASDTRRSANGPRQGLYADEQNKLATALSGKQTEVVFGNGASLLGAVAATIAKGQSVPAVLTREDGRGHSVLIESLKGDKITFLDPHAGRITCSLAEFLAQLQSVNLSKTQVSSTLRAESQKIEAGGRGVLATAGDWWNPVTWIQKSSEVVTNVVKAGAAIVAPVVKGVVAVTEKVVSTAGAVAGGVVSAVGSVVSSTVNGVFQAGASLVQGIANVGGMLGDAWNTYGSYVMMGASLVSMFVPGLQVVTLAIAAYQAYQSGDMLLEGIRTGDLKKSLLGIAGMAAALSGGAGALGAKVLGGGAMAVANVAGKVSNVAKQLVAVTDAIQEGNPGKLLGAAASLLGEGGQALGNGSDALVKRATDFAEKANGYAQKATGLYRAISKGELSATSLATALAADVVAELGGSSEVQANLKRGSALFDVGTQGVVALQRGDWGQALDAALKGGETLGVSLPRNETLDKVRRLASLSGKGNDALLRRDVDGVRGALQELGKELGFAIPGLEHLDSHNLHRVGGLFAAVQRGDVGQALVLGAELGQALGVQLPRHEILDSPELQRASRLAAIIQQGDGLEVAKALGQELGLDTTALPPALESVLKGLGTLEAVIAEGEEAAWGLRDQIMGGIEETILQAERLAEGWQEGLGALLQHNESLLKALHDERASDARKAVEGAAGVLTALGKRSPFDSTVLASLAEAAVPMEQDGRLQAIQHAEQLVRRTQEAMTTLRAQQEGLMRQATAIERAVQAQSAEILESELNAFRSAARQLVGMAIA